jgi:hypothetical protein
MEDFRGGGEEVEGLFMRTLRSPDGARVWPSPPGGASQAGVRVDEGQRLGWGSMVCVLELSKRRLSAPRLNAH